MVHDTVTGQVWDISLRAFANRHRSRYNPYVLGAKIEVVEQADSTATVRIEVGTEVYTTTYGSYEVAKGFFGEQKGWRGSKVWSAATKHFYKQDLAIDYSNDVNFVAAEYARKQNERTA